jgi:integrase
MFATVHAPFTDDYFVLYSLRHCFASRHTENQTDPITLSELLGHCDLKTLKRYAHPSSEHKAEAIKRLEKFECKSSLKRQKVSFLDTGVLFYPSNCL